MIHPTAFQAFPESARLIADVIGPRATLALSETLTTRLHDKTSDGSASFYIPKTIPRGHWITSTVGLSASNKLCKEFGGELLSLPKCRAVYRANRNQSIRDLHASGTPLEELATKFGVSADTVKRVINPELKRRHVERERERARKRKPSFVNGGGGVGGTILTSEEKAGTSARIL